MTEKNISNMKKQLKSIGLSIDWERKFLLVIVNTTSISKLFIDLYNGTAGKKDSYVNDSVDETVLANEQ